MNIGRIIRFIYHWMQRHYLTFRVLVWLKEKGITRRVNFLISHSTDEYQRANPTKEMLSSQEFFSSPQNVVRLRKVLTMLADDISKETLRACIDYRTKRIPIPNHLYSEHNQYFVEDIIKLSNDEVFIDGGAYTGDTIQQLFDTAKKNKVSIQFVMAFEPDSENYQIINNFYGKKKNVHVIKKGLSERKTTLFFKSEGVNAKIVENQKDADYLIDVVGLDEIIECNKATFIKMDIEGAEYDALHGASNIIKNNRPKLAICIYHSDEDMIRIIEYIHGLVPEYKLYVRHHSKSEVETVLYALI